MSAVTKAIAKFVPNIDLPRYFRIVSTPLRDSTQVVLLVNVKGELQEFDSSLPKAPSFYDVITLFPTVDPDDIPGMVRTIGSAINLPRSWKLECGPAEGGFLLTLDIFKNGTSKHWEKKIEVTTVQLKELLDVVEWVKEANQVDRFEKRDAEK